MSTLPAEMETPTSETERRGPSMLILFGLLAFVFAPALVLGLLNLMQN